MSPFRGKFRNLELKVCVQGYGQTIDSLVGGEGWTLLLGRRSSTTNLEVSLLPHKMVTISFQYPGGTVC